MSNTFELISKSFLIKEKRKLFTGSVGLVPTMGNLHAGHLSLINAALLENDHVIISVFVNPKQFNNPEDLKKYPRTIHEDIEEIKAIMNHYTNKNVIVFYPNEIAEIYPQGFSTTISLNPLSTIIEGKDRPGHFDGVSTIVFLLLQLVHPQKAYFGLKDYQQYILVKNMCRDLLLPVEIIGLPIVRSETGLALSSRNNLLTENGKDKALILQNTLQSLKDELIHYYKTHHHIDAQFAFNLLNNALKKGPFTYLELRDAEDFSEITSKTKHFVVLGAALIENVRLLDNINFRLSP